MPEPSLGKDEGREIRTPNLLIWSQTRCRCAIPPMPSWRLSSLQSVGAKTPKQRHLGGHRKETAAAGERRRANVSGKTAPARIRRQSVGAKRNTKRARRRAASGRSKRKRSETIGAKASHARISLGRCVARLGRCVARCVVGSRWISQSSGRRYPATADLYFSSLSGRKSLGTYLGG